MRESLRLKTLMVSSATCPTVNQTLCFSSTLCRWCVDTCVLLEADCDKNQVNSLSTASIVAIILFSVPAVILLCIALAYGICGVRLCCSCFGNEDPYPKGLKKDLLEDDDMSSATPISDTDYQRYLSSYESYQAGCSESEDIIPENGVQYHQDCVNTLTQAS